MKKTLMPSRLGAFFDSKVINALMIAAVTGLLVSLGSELSAVPLAGALAAIALAAGYALWFWIKRPQNIVVNKQLSQFSGYFTLYFLIMTAARFESPLWYIFPVICAVIRLFITLIRGGDELRTF